MMENTIPKLTPEDVERLERLRLGKRVENQLRNLGHVEAGQDGMTKQQAYAARAKFIAASWLLGASMGQLSSLFRVSRPTISNIVQREASPAAKNRAQRLAISWERVSAFWAAYCDHVGEFAGDNAETAATRLLSLEKEYEE